MVATVSLFEIDQEIAKLIEAETLRQEEGLEMIPSENFVSEAVLEAMGSVLTNKYAEGLPAKRYYGGCEYCDSVETIAQDRAKALIGCEFVNIQPHSGAAANQAAFEAILSPGDTVMGMKLDHGGHLTHGLPVNFSGKYYQVVAYGVDKDTQRIDYDEVRDLAKANNPKMIICGATAYSRQIDFKTFRSIADEVGAVVLADIAHYAGLIACGLYPSPVEHCQIVTTTTHKTLRGPRSGFIMGTKQFAKKLNRAVFPGLQGGPHMHTIAAKAVALKEALDPAFKEYSQNVIDNAQALADELIKLGFSLVTGGTDSHLILVDVRTADITGKDAAGLLGKVDITVNMNTIPFDPEPPRVCSGIRLGSPALTTRGMGVAEMKQIAGMISDAVKNRDNEAKLQSIKDDVRSLTKDFPLYRHRLPG